MTSASGDPPVTPTGVELLCDLGKEGPGWKDNFYSLERPWNKKERKPGGLGWPPLQGPWNSSPSAPLFSDLWLHVTPSLWIPNTSSSKWLCSTFSSSIYPDFENEIKEIPSLSGDLRKEKKIDVRIVHLKAGFQSNSHVVERPIRTISRLLALTLNSLLWGSPNH